MSPVSDWLIIKTARLQEQKLAKRIEALGFPAWVPVEVRWHKTKQGAGKPRRNRIWEAPALPRTVFAAVPVASYGDLMALEGYDSLHVEKATGTPSKARFEAIEIFRAALDRENTIRRRQYARRQEGKRPVRRLKLGDPDLANVLFEELFGLKPDVAEAA